MPTEWQIASLPYERYGGPCIVVDFGTATKFEVISAEGRVPGRRDCSGTRIERRCAVFSRSAA